MFHDSLQHSYNRKNDLVDDHGVSWEAITRIRRIIDKNDGEVDYRVLERFIKKNGWDIPREVIKKIERLEVKPPPQG